MRLIDADLIKDTISIDYYEHFTISHDTDQIALIDMVCDDIDESPTIDPENFRPHGKWEHTHTSESYYSECWKCSVCGFEDTEGYGFDYCPNCGAKMDSEG